jgi:competence protein ComEC
MFILNVGQADTSVIVTPAGKVIVIDIVNPAKVLHLLQSIGLAEGEPLDYVIITHPHSDHFGGASGVIRKYPVQHIFMASFTYYSGTAGYHALINQLELSNVRPNFLSGSTTFYPDAGFGNPDGPVVHVVGPDDNLLRRLHDAGDLTPNHLSLMTKVAFSGVTVISAGDAQMENWSVFDAHGLMPAKCHVLKAAHHGSRHGTQSERVERLHPRFTIVSSDPGGRHSLPDLVGAATYCTHSAAGEFVALTRDIGTVEFRVGRSGSLRAVHYGDNPADVIPFGNDRPLLRSATPTDWPALIRQRLKELEED